MAFAARLYVHNRAAARIDGFQMIETPAERAAVGSFAHARTLGMTLISTVMKTIKVRHLRHRAGIA
jgi:hypothetical protein